MVVDKCKIKSQPQLHIALFTKKLNYLEFIF